MAETGVIPAFQESQNRHRGKGQQKMTVEHVRIRQGGHVGNVEAKGGWGRTIRLTWPTPHILGARYDN
jgi:hypothetical protein